MDTTKIQNANNRTTTKPGQVNFFFTSIYLVRLGWNVMNRILEVFSDYKQIIIGIIIIIIK